MNVTAIKTRIIEANSCTLTDLLDKSLTDVRENSVIAITSKIVALCEGNVASQNEYEKDELIEKEADLFIPKSQNPYGVYLTIKNSMLIPSAGIDASNSNGYYVMWPKDPQASAKQCWDFIRKRFNIEHLGVIITDSTTTPLRWGVTGKSIAYCGFKPLDTKIGKPDLFGRILRETRINIADALAASAVLVMGEADEQTPIAILENLPFVEFLDHSPSIDEVNALKIDMTRDLYAHLLTNAKWQSPKKG